MIIFFFHNNSFFVNGSENIYPQNWTQHQRKINVEIYILNVQVDTTIVNVKLRLSEKIYNDASIVILMTHHFIYHVNGFKK